ncbi:TetR/AcrR family transcriptional regulator [Oricola cellulosilytica]|uniref:TetR/AcrR family transcriptional regulator n=1 Tax=Oricola cellulosilytica TaxID=1429082 RepID=A0A4R0P9Z6_9HYPH|nr:TetR/AcrR family transcriptional regulator [Oricola cellulosilytica]TCD14081.1 TetR/AcrR family transcriptional regulator [Oricola cellulosilytica]
MPALSTRQQIVEKADALFYAGGFEATSFADIAAALGISRGNFYYHFRTKDEILDAVIDRRMENTRAMLGNWAEEDDAPKDRILSFVRILVTNRTKIMAFGCPVGTLSTELAKLDHAAHGRAAEIFAMYREWLSDQFRAGGQGDRADSLAMHLLGRVQGVAVMMTAFPDEDFIRREVGEIEIWLGTLFEPDIRN